MSLGAIAFAIWLVNYYRNGTNMLAALLLALACAAGLLFDGYSSKLNGRLLNEGRENGRNSRVGRVVLLLVAIVVGVLGYIWARFYYSANQ